jgi:hypothetical protein
MQTNVMNVSVYALSKNRRILGYQSNNQELMINVRRCTRKPMAVNMEATSFEPLSIMELYLHKLFSSSFLHIRSRSRHPCYWLTLPTAKCVRDLHPIADYHAQHTSNKAHDSVQVLEMSAFLSSFLSSKTNLTD